MKVKAVVKRVVSCDDEHESFFVAASEDLDGLVRCSLEPTTWKSDRPPKEGDIVRLKRLRRKRTGLIANSGRFWKLSDEKTIRNKKDLAEKMSWRQRVELILDELGALKKRAEKYLGTSDLIEIATCANQHPIEHYMRMINTQNLVTHPVETNGARCLILSSLLFREFGILFFDGPTLGVGLELTMVGADECIGHPKFRMVCGDCSPHLEGLPKSKYSSMPKDKGGEQVDSDKKSTLVMAFGQAIKKACKKHGITLLFFQCWDSMMSQDCDGLHLIGWEKLKTEVDCQKFAIAFSEIEFGDRKFPFEDMFEVKIIEAHVS